MKVPLLALLCAVLPLCARASDANVVARGNLENARHKFQEQKTGHVAFLGGSITEMEGYRPMVGELLKQRASVDIVHIPYKGAAQAVIDLIAGRVDIQWLSCHV